MKKNLLLLCSAGLMSLSLVSCGGKAKNIDADEGNEIVENAVDKTNERLESVAKGDVIGFKFNTNASVEGKVVVNIPNGEGTIDVNSIDIKTSANAELAANLNMTQLRITPNADMSDTALYAKMGADVEVKYESSAVGENADVPEDIKETVSVEMGLKNSQLTGTFNMEPENPLNQTLDAASANEFAKIIVALVDGNMDSLMPDAPEGETDPTIEMVEFVSDLLVSYTTGEMTITQVVDVLDESFGIFTGEMVALKQPVVSLLEVVDSVSINDYLSFKKVTEKKHVTLTTDFNYSDWKADFTSALESKVPQTDPSYMIYNTFAEMIALVLPEDLTASYSLGIHKDGYMDSFSFNFAVKGAIPESVFGLLVVPPAPMAADTTPALPSASYDLKLSGSTDFSISNKAVDVKTVNVA